LTIDAFLTLIFIRETEKYISFYREDGLCFRYPNQVASKRLFTNHSYINLSRLEMLSKACPTFGGNVEK
jgi:hypothetical protein